MEIIKATSLLVAGFVLAHCGINFMRWEWWVINICYIIYFGW